MRNENARPNDPAAKPKRWLWRPNRRRGNCGLLLLQASLPVYFLIVLPENAFPQQIPVFFTLFALSTVGLFLFVSGFGIGSKINVDKLIRSTTLAFLGVCIPLAIAALINSFTPSLVVASIMFICQFFAAWLFDCLAKQLDKATQPALSPGSTNK